MRRGMLPQTAFGSHPAFSVPGVANGRYQISVFSFMLANFINDAG
jgi:hypothetical protein